MTERKSGEIYGVMYITMQVLDFGQFHISYTSKENNVAIINGTGMIYSNNRTEFIEQQELRLLIMQKRLSNWI